MKEYLDRMEAERTELNGKIEKLQAFLLSDKVQALDFVQTFNLKTQAAIMTAYSEILLARITYDSNKGEQK